eukprot:9160884-Ditylum_brightwellii.AAC.1
MNIGNLYQEGIEEAAFLQRHIQIINSLPDDAIDDRDNLKIKIGKSQNTIFERKSLSSSAVSAFDEYSPFTEFYNRSDLEEKRDLYTSPSDICNLCGGVTSANSPKLCVYKRGLCKAANHKKRIYGLLIPDALYVRLSKQYIYPLFIVAKHQLASKIFEAMKMVQLSIEDAIHIRKDLISLTVEEATEYCIQNYLGGDEFKNFDDSDKDKKQSHKKIKKTSSLLCQDLTM